jgi:glycosyltransferase involved in cell wall biosynthesis
LRPNVLHIIDSFESGGSERQAIQLVRLVQASGRCNVRLACLQNKGSLRSEADLIGTGEIFEYPLTSFYDWNFVVQLRRLRDFLRKNDISVVRTHCFYTNVFGMAAATLARIPARVTYKGETEGFRTERQKTVERTAFRFAHCVIANSDAVRDQLIREGVDSSKIVRLYNGFDVERVKADPGQTRKEILEKFDLPDRRFVTIVANLRHPVKNHPMFLRAAAQVRAEVPGVAFVLAGEGELLPSLRQLAIDLGIERDVFFIGRCEDVSGLLSVSQVGVLSSTAEGFSNAILEYMAAKLPVVATDVGGAREAITEGETGYLVPSGDEKAMAERIIDLLREPEKARRMGERGESVVQGRFSSELQLKNTIELYEGLLADRKPTRLRLKPKAQESL